MRVNWYYLSFKMNSLLACCNRQSVGCATYVMITNILTFIFSAVLIDFDRKIINPSLSSLSYIYGDTFNTDCTRSSSGQDLINLGNLMLGLTKGQLAGGVLMLVSALLFIGIYVYVYIRALQHDGRMSHPPYIGGAPPAQPLPQSTTYHVPYSGSAQNTVPPGYDSRVIVCPKCHTVVEASGRF